MSYTITTKKPFTSNKPPKPIPTPDNDLFPNEITLENGEKAWISIPQPDKLCFTIHISGQVMGSVCPVDHPPKKIAKDIGEYLLSEPWNSHHVEHKMFYQNPSCHWVRLKMGKRGSSVLFKFLFNKQYGHRLQIECNPRKLGRAGMYQLTQVLVGSDPTVSPNELFSPSTFAQNAKLTRLDIAVDVVGVPVEHMLAWHKKEGKRSYYTSDSGTLETIIVHRKKRPPKIKFDKYGDPQKISHSANPAGRAAIKIYDRVNERAAVLKPPPYGPAPVSRIEVVKNHFQKKFLNDIPDLPDPFKDMRVGSIFDQVEYDKLLFYNYASLRRVADKQTASDKSGIIPKDMILFEKALKVPKPSFVNRKTNWSQWEQGLIRTGLDILINASDTVNSISLLQIGGETLCN